MIDAVSATAKMPPSSMRRNCTAPCSEENDSTILSVSSVSPPSSIL